MLVYILLGLALIIGLVILFFIFKGRSSTSSEPIISINDATDVNEEPISSSTEQVASSNTAETPSADQVTNVE